MKILYVSQFYYPEITAGAFRSTDNSTIWSEDNHDITVFTTYPNFPNGKVLQEYSNKLISKDKKNNVKLIRNKIIAMKNTSKFNRGISSASFLLFSIFNMIFNCELIEKDYDVVLGTSGTVLAPIVSYVFSRIYKVPFVLELRDVTYNQMLAVYKRKTLLYYLVKLIEIFLCKKASKIVVVTHGFKSILIRDGIKAEKIEVIPNGAIVKECEISQQLNKKEKITFSYIGNIGGAQNLKKVIDVFDNLKIYNMDKELIIIGDGGKKDVLREYIRKRKVRYVKMIDGMEPTLLGEHYQKSDFCIVSLNNNNKFIETIPSKTFSIMANKRPILFLGPNGEASKIIENSNCGLVYTSKNYKEVAKNISETINLYLKEDRLEKVIKDYGNAGYEYVNSNYNRENLAKKYIEVFRDVIKT